MVNIFLPGYFLLGGLGLLIGAGIGEFLAQRFPHQRFLFAIGLYLALAVAIFVGADVEALLSGLMASGRNVDAGLVWFVGKRIFLFGMISGAALFCQQRQRTPQIFALAVSGVIGLPIMMNIWMGAGMTYATQGLAA
ncbi:MAG: hypothetical protein WA989_13550 [Henriciella sp.]|uniref:hypothetical protein n=1 Tax=Henriciella sp. TaxID=1968823 RepID=UPI003C75C582